MMCRRHKYQGKDEKSFFFPEIYEELQREQKKQGSTSMAKKKSDGRKQESKVKNRSTDNDHNTEVA